LLRPRRDRAGHRAGGGRHRQRGPHLGAHAGLRGPVRHRLERLRADRVDRRAQLRRPGRRVSAVLVGRPQQRPLAGLPRAGRDPVRAVLRGAAGPSAAGLAFIPERVVHAGGAVAGGGGVHRPARLLARLRRAERRHRAVGRLAGRPVGQHLGGHGGGGVAARRLRHDHLSRGAEGGRPGAEGGRRHRRRERVADVLPGGVPDAAAGQRDRAGDHRDRGAARVRHRLRDQQGQERARTAVSAGHREHRGRGQPDRVRLGHRGDPAGDLARVHRHLPVAAVQGGAMTAATSTGRRVRPLRWLLHAFLALVALGWLLPLLLAVYASLRPYEETARLGYFSLPEELTLGYYGQAWSQAELPRYYLNTLIIVIPALVLTLFLASFVAFAIA